ncbi:MAG: Yip1 family protein [Clostridia bacterium]
MQKMGFYAGMSKYVYPLYTVIHPVDGYREMKNNKKYSLLAANIVLALWVLQRILAWACSDFDFKAVRALETPVNLPQILLTTVVVFAIACVSNWCFCTLMDGKGRLYEIWVACAYALIPYVVLGIVRVGLTHFMVLDEAVFLTYMNVIALAWSGYMLFMAIYTIHDYTFPKTVTAIVLTIVGVLIIAFLVVLVTGLASQIYSFFKTIFYEIKLRYM